jgi:hypothetical protein
MNSMTRLKINISDASTLFNNPADLLNDPEKIKEFHKALEDFIIDDESEMIGEQSQIIPDSRPYDKEQYDSILLNARSSRSLCEKFDSEPSGLLKSDAVDYNFSLDDILNRMVKGHKVYKYNYNTPTRKIVTIKVNSNIVEIYKNEHRKNRIGFSDVYGISLGPCSSTFKMFKSHVDHKHGKIHEPEDCFSVISEFRSFDFGTTSSLAKYDICLSLSWLCSLNNRIQSNVPFTKCKNILDYLSYFNINQKLKKEAEARFLSVTELFLVLYIQLGIYKTLKQMENTAGMNRIVLILNKRFSFDGKLYRFIKLVVMPLVQGDKYIKKEVKDKIRVNLLIGNKIKKLSQIIGREEQKEDKLIYKTKKTVLDSMTIPSCSSLFKKKKYYDPFLAVLRKGKLENARLSGYNIK